MLRIASALAHTGPSAHGVVLNCTDTFQDQNYFVQIMNNNDTGLIPALCRVCHLVSPPSRELHLRNYSPHARSCLVKGEL